MPEIHINRKTGEIEIVGDCGAEWEGTCQTIKVSKGKIILKCDTELTKECPDVKFETPAKVIQDLSHYDPEDWDINSPDSMAGQVMQMGWAQMTDGDVAVKAIEILSDEHQLSGFYYLDDADNYRVVLYGDEDWGATALEELADRVRNMGDGETDNPYLPEGVCNKLKDEGLQCNYETTDELEPGEWYIFHIFLEGKHHPAHGLPGEEGREKEPEDYPDTIEGQMLMVRELNFSQVTHEDEAINIIYRLHNEHGLIAAYYQDTTGNFYIIPHTSMLVEEGVADMADVVKAKGDAVTSSETIADGVVDTLRNEGLIAGYSDDSEGDKERYIVSISPPGGAAPGGKAPGGCKKCQPGGTPGKFEASGKIGEQLWEISMDGADEEIGSTQDFGWYGLLIETGILEAQHAIVNQDSQGFVDYAAYDTEKEARAAWAKLEAEAAEFYTN